MIYFSVYVTEVYPPGSVFRAEKACELKQVFFYKAGEKSHKETESSFRAANFWIKDRKPSLMKRF